MIPSHYSISSSVVYASACASVSLLSVRCLSLLNVHLYLS